MRGKGFGKYKAWRKERGALAELGKGGKAWGAPPFLQKAFLSFPRCSAHSKSIEAIFRPWRWEEELLAFKLEAGDGLLGIGLIHQLMNFLAASCLTFGHLAGLTIMTLYWFRRALSPSTRIFRGASPLAAALYLM